MERFCFVMPSMLYPGKDNDEVYVSYIV